jgi:glutathione synthase/RimK-type ligase-like ATP-grasp enzyme
MNVFILRRKGSGIKTASGIAQAIGENAQVIRSDNLHNLDTNPDILIRWGCGKYLVSNFNINDPDMILHMDNKRTARRILLDNGVSVPNTFFNKEQAMQYNFDRPLIGRPKYHSQGKNMSILNNKEELEDDKISDYWSEYIPKDREFRVYVFFGRAIGICEKRAERNSISWNNPNNSAYNTLSLSDQHYPLQVIYLALQAARAANVDFAAVDIINQDDKCYVLELNCSPSCSPYRQRVLAKAFKWAIHHIENNGSKPDLFPAPINHKELILPCLIKE